MLFISELEFHSLWIAGALCRRVSYLQLSKSTIHAYAFPVQFGSPDSVELIFLEPSISSSKWITSKLWGNFPRLNFRPRFCVNDHWLKLMICLSQMNLFKLTRIDFDSPGDFQTTLHYSHEFACHLWSESVWEDCSLKALCCSLPLFARNTTRFCKRFCMITVHPEALIYFVCWLSRPSHSFRWSWKVCLCGWDNIWRSEYCSYSSTVQWLHEDQ